MRPSPAQLFFYIMGLPCLMALSACSFPTYFYLINACDVAKQVKLIQYRFSPPKKIAIRAGISEPRLGDFEKYRDSVPIQDNSIELPAQTTAFLDRGMNMHSWHYSALLIGNDTVRINTANGFQSKGKIATGITRWYVIH